MNVSSLTRSEQVPSPHEDELLDTPQAARFMACSEARLEKWRTDGGGPAFVKVGALVRYRKSAINRWLDAHTVSSTSGARRKRRG